MSWATKKDLDKILTMLVGHCESVKTAGKGIGAFIVAGKGNLGVELYPSDEEGNWVIDPAVGDELQGELEFKSMLEAVNAAITWLNKGET